MLQFLRVILRLKGGEILNRKKIIGIVLLFFAALFWGIAFVAQDKGAAHMDGFTFQAVRSLIGSAALVPVFLTRDALAKKNGTYVPPTAASRKWLLWGGLACGVIVCAATLFQQFSIANNVTSPGKDAFITALYIVFVPVFSLFLGKRAQPHVYVCVAIALGGLWMLCMNGSSITVGDLQGIICSLIFSLHIIVLGFVAPRVDGVRLSALQFFVSGTISAVFMFTLGDPSIEGIVAGIWPILYAGVISCAGAYTLQILGQRDTPPTLACLVMSLESVFAVLASIVLLPEIPAPTTTEWIGMALIFAAIICSQLTLPYPRRKTE